MDMMMVYLLTFYLYILLSYIKIHMHKRIVLIIFTPILLPLLTVVGVTSSVIIGNQAFAATFQNNRYNYSIWYPSDWIVNGSVWSSIIVIQPKIDACKCTLLVVGAAGPDTTDTTGTTQPNIITLEHSKDIWTNQELTFEPVKNVTHITFLAIPAYKIVYGTNPLVPKQQMTKILTVKNGIEYSLDFDAHDPHLPVIKKMIDSFQIITK
jgi:hypothetical protein